MKKDTCILFALILCCTFPLHPETKNVKYSGAESGLILRSKPDQKSKPILLIPYASPLKFLHKTDHKQQIEEISDYWVEVEFRNIRGFVFGGFLLSIKPPAKNSSTLKDYWKNTIGNDVFTSYYQIAQKEPGTSTYQTQPQKYTVRPEIELQSQILVYFVESKNSNGSYESFVINDAGNETLKLKNITLVEAALISMIYIPKAIKKSKDAMTIILREKSFCYKNEIETYKIDIESDSSGGKISITGSLGDMNYCTKTSEW